MSHELTPLEAAKASVVKAEQDAQNPKFGGKYAKAGQNKKKLQLVAVLVIVAAVGVFWFVTR